MTLSRNQKFSTGQVLDILTDFTNCVKHKLNVKKLPLIRLITYSLYRSYNFSYL
jgi:hypothetical protein